MQKLPREIAEKMADAIPDLCRDYHDIVVFASHRKDGYVVRIACIDDDRAVPNQLPAGILRWVRKTPAFTLDFPHVDNGTLFVDVVPVG